MRGNSIRRVAVAVCAAVGLGLALAACQSTGSATDAGSAGSPAPVTSGQQSVTVPPLAPGDAPGPSANASPHDGAVSAPPSDSATAPSTTAPPPPAAATVTGSPAFGSTGLAPAAPITLQAHGGTLAWVTMTNPDGDRVKGALSADKTGWNLGEPLGYGKTYSVTGVAVNAIGVQTEFHGTYTAATTKQPITTSISPGDGKVVGVAAPVIVRFGIAPEDKALIEKHVSITTDPPVEGAWAWIRHNGSSYPSLDWRPKEFWPAGTTVHVESNIYGVKFQDGWYGGDDVSVDFTIGRNQVVKADADSQKVQVLRDGEVVRTFYGSFGRGDRVGDPNLVTRSGIHVVTNKHEIYKMSNPAYGYEDVTEYWAVRISSNGEFLHNNPGTSAWALKNRNISHGCVNLSWDDAKWYYESAMYGDPVIVTGSSIQLSAADGDIFDWTIPWDKWLTMSALPQGSAQGSAPDTTAAPEPATAS